MIALAIKATSTMRTLTTVALKQTLFLSRGVCNA